MPRAIILNCCNSSNYGDQAIGKSMKDSFEIAGFEVDSYDIYFLDEDHKSTEISFNIDEDSFFETKSVKNVIELGCIRAKLNNIRWFIKHRHCLKKIAHKRYDLLVFGGGELVQSNGIFPQLINNWLKVLSVKNKKIRTVLFSVGVTSSYTERDKKLLKNSFSLINEIYVRDQTSYKNVLEHYDRKSVVIPDSVIGGYTLAEDVNDSDVVLFGITSFTRVCRYNFNNFSRRCDYYDWCLDEIEKHQINHKKVHLIYSDLSDKKECLIFEQYAKKKGKHYCVANYNSLEEFDSAIRKCNKVVSPRMHACIIGMLYGKTVVPINLSNKLESFEKEYQINGFIRPPYQEKFMKEVKKEYILCGDR